MDQPKRKHLLFGFLVLALIMGAIFMFSNTKEPKPAPTAGPGIYYTGPMRSKGDPNLYGTEDGKKVPPPPGVDTGSAPKSMSNPGTDIANP